MLPTRSRAISPESPPGSPLVVVKATAIAAPQPLQVSVIHKPVRTSLSASSSHDFAGGGNGQKKRHSACTSSKRTHQKRRKTFDSAQKVILEVMPFAKCMLEYDRLPWLT